MNWEILIPITTGVGLGLILAGKFAFLIGSIVGAGLIILSISLTL